MYTFEVKSVTPNFPSEVAGLLVQDTGGPFRFSARLSAYQEHSNSFIALFVSEMVARREIPSLLECNSEGKLGAIATFGVLNYMSGTPLGTSHLEVISREIGIPFIQLRKPGGYWNRQKQWVNKNPLKTLYGLQTILSYDGLKATFRTAG